MRVFSPSPWPSLTLNENSQVYVMCSGDLADLPGPGGYAAATIIARNVGKEGFLALWAFVCFTAFAVVATASASFFPLR